MSKNYIALGALIGGGTGSLDKIDGALLSGGDAAQVTIAGAVYHYHLNATSGATENSPYVISPDTNPGTKRWILVTPAGAFSHVRAIEDSGQSISNAAYETIVFGTEDYDTLGEYNNATGIFTATYSGYYTITSAACFVPATWAQYDLLVFRFDKESAGVNQIFNSMAAGSTQREYVQMSTGIYLAATDTFNVSIYQNTGGALALDVTANYTWLTIDRIA